jgi:hypothetical protein
MKVMSIFLAIQGAASVVLSFFSLFWSVFDVEVGHGCCFDDWSGA